MEKRKVLEGKFESGREKYQASRHSTFVLNLPKINIKRLFFLMKLKKHQ